MQVSTVRNILILIIIILFSAVFVHLWQVEHTSPAMSYSAFISGIAKGEIKEISIRGEQVTGKDIYGRDFSTVLPENGSAVDKLAQKGVQVIVEDDSPSAVLQFIRYFLPVMLLGIVLIILAQRPAAKGRKSPGFDKAKAVTTIRDVTFDNVAGIGEAKPELYEIIDFLKRPESYTRLGGRIPKGVLIQGPPGTGKTLLARAIAGEAGVPFFSISGSDFVEMFVGVGASRVRDLFKEAKKNAPCIVFIDEIDAVGGHRGSGAGASGGQDERQQTLNALLVEMDGFQSDETVVVVAATNRPDILDPALMRPGRFDRQVNILPPDVKGRQQILDIYAGKVVMAPAVALDNVAAMTPGFTGADLANLVNEAALMAARKGKDAIELDDLEESKDKIVMGSERKELVVNEQERRSTAYHEAGHAILAYLLPETDPIFKVSIVPRGRAMGVTQQIPLDDRHSYSRLYLVNRIKILLGGRVAEELVFNHYTTGAYNDLQTATEVATRMICEWGMGESLGPRAYATTREDFLGGSSSRSIFSEDTARIIDEEINRVIEDAYQEAMIILEGKMNYLHELAEYLLKNETIDGDELEIIIKCPKVGQREAGSYGQ
jgi:cell division protease FtsH